MYIKVNEKNQKQIDTYNQIWIECWQEKGYELEFTENADRFIIQDDNKANIGTIEFIKYAFGKNNCEQLFKYRDLQEVYQFSEQVVEIDKISILKKFRGKNIERLLYTIFKYSKENEVKYGIGLMEPIFYQTIKTFYKIPTKKLAKKSYYKGDWVIPVIIDFDEVHKNTKKYKWIKSFESEFQELT